MILIENNLCKMQSYIIVIIIIIIIIIINLTLL